MSKEEKEVYLTVKTSNGDTVAAVVHVPQEGTFGGIDRSPESSRFWRTATKEGLLKQKLKSLGLYWRKWPEEKPRNDEEVITIVTFPTVTKFYWAAIYCNNTTQEKWVDDDHEKKCEEGDLWLPIEALKVLE